MFMDIFYAFALVLLVQKKAEIILLALAVSPPP